MGKVSDKICRKNQNTHVKFKNTFSKDRALYENKMEKYDRAREATDDIIQCRKYYICMPNK
jgi:hypothetical protein